MAGNKKEQPAELLRLARKQSAAKFDSFDDSVMAAARREDSLNHIDTAAAWLRRVTASEEHSAARLAGRGVATLFVACGSRNEENRQAVFRVTGSLGASPAEDCVHEEVTAMLGE